MAHHTSTRAHSRARTQLFREFNSIIQTPLTVYSHSIICNRFTARCYAERGLSQDVCLSICLSVCLSHAGIVSKRLNTSSNVFHHRVATPHRHRFPNQMVWQYSDGDPLTGASNAGGMKVWKNRDFLRLSRYISEMIQDYPVSRIEPQLLWNVKRKPYPSFQTVGYTSFNYLEWRWVT